MSEVDAPDVFALVPPQAGAGRRAPVKYPKSLAHYAAVYGKSVRSIGYYIEAGRTHPMGEQLPPLDDPEKMPAWWSGVMDQACPRSILEAASAAGSAVIGNQPPRSVSLPDGSETPVVSSGGGGGVDLADFERRLLDWKAQRDRAYIALTMAQSDPEFSEAYVTARRKEWMELDEKTGRAEEEAIQKRKELGELVHVEELRSELGPILSGIASSFRVMYHRLRPQLKDAADQSQEDKIIQGGIDSLFAELKTARFHEGLRLVA